MSAGLPLSLAALGALAGAGTPWLATRCTARFAGTPLVSTTVPRRWVPWAAVGAAVFGGLGVAPGVGAALPAFLAVAAIGLVLAAVDLACLRLPDPLVGLAALAALAGLGAAAAITGRPERLLGALAGAALSFAAYVLLALLPASRLGFGDVKLAAVLGLLLGWLGGSALLTGLLLPHVLHGLAVLALLATRRARRDTLLPLGPALLAATCLTPLLH
ncbi:prepilin peptidase [Micromonospora sp. DT233]|uniref:prepilin peptidase n=1 Tax=Micromonospora sp. DT233 TaxID=3393432 RepID=UPI003CF072D3